MSREDLVKRAISAVNERDVEAYLACCTDDIRLYTPLAHFTGPNEGPAGIRQFFRDIQDASPDFRLELERLELVGEQALAFLRVHSSGRISGVPLDQETANVYDFAGDRIERVRIFADREEALTIVGMPEASDLGKRQLELIAKLAALEPAPSFMGGFAEDAILAGTVTRPHEDVDLIFPRRQEELRMEQLAELGFRDWETWGEAAPGVPFYLFGQNGDLKLDLGLTDESDGKIWMRVHRLTFTVGGEEAPAGYQLQLPDDLFDQLPVELDGIAIKPIPPLAMYQIRAGVAHRNSFGPLSDRHLETLAQLRARFFPDRAEEELLPPSEPLPG